MTENYRLRGNLEGGTDNPSFINPPNLNINNNTSNIIENRNNRDLEHHQNHNNHNNHNNDNPRTNHLKFFSGNIYGLNDLDKTRKVFKELKHDIICLQETKISNNKKDTIKKKWKGVSFWNCENRSAGGTAILFSKEFQGEIKEEDVLCILNGRVIIAPFKLNGEQI